MQMTEKLGLLYDYAARKPDGFTYVDIENDLGWDRSEFFNVTRQLRRLFADDTITLICDPQRKAEPWLYRLVGNYDDARSWATTRIGDLETRLGTIQSVAETVTNTTDGRTIEGRKARKVHRTITRLIEDLDEISDSVVA